MRYLEPWEIENEDALEVIVGDTRVAWTVNDDVLVHTGNTTERADGYVRIGELQWVDTPDDPADDGGYNIDRLREFVNKWKKGQS